MGPPTQGSLAVLYPPSYPSATQHFLRKDPSTRPQDGGGGVDGGDEGGGGGYGKYLSRVVRSNKKANRTYLNAKLAEEAERGRAVAIHHHHRPHYNHPHPLRGPILPFNNNTNKSPPPLPKMPMYQLLPIPLSTPTRSCITLYVFNRNSGTWWWVLRPLRHLLLLLLDRLPPSPSHLPLSAMVMLTSTTKIMMMKMMLPKLTTV